MENNLLTLKSFKEKFLHNSIRNEIDEEIMLSEASEYLDSELFDEYQAVCIGCCRMYSENMSVRESMRWIAAEVRILLNRLMGTVYSEIFEDDYVFFLTRKQSEHVVEKMKQLFSELNKSTPELVFYCGIGSRITGWRSYHDSVHEAKQTVRAMKILGYNGLIRRSAEMKPYLLLLDTRDRKSLFHYSNFTFQRLFLPSDNGNIASGELARTLEMYFRNGRNATSTAEKLFLHRNTLHQRLRKIEEICNIDLSDNENSFLLEFSFYVEKFLLMGEK